MKVTTNITIVISYRNEFDENGKSLDNWNSTEVEVFDNGIQQVCYRISGTEYRKPELIGKVFEGYMDSLGFYHIKAC